MTIHPRASGFDREADELSGAVRAAIDSAYGDPATEDGADAAISPWPESRLGRAEFDALARRVLRYQATHNLAYARYARALGVDPVDLADPLDAPPVPTDAFKRTVLTTFDPMAAVACFRSSGTTQADRGRHYVRTLDVMRASIDPPFARYVLAGLASPRAVVLAPDHADAPESSLYFMFSHLCRRFARPAEHTHYVSADGQLDTGGARQALHRAAADGEPVLLLGPSFSWVHFLDRAPDFRTQLPAGSRLLETGGFKGRSREVQRDELHAALSERLGLALANILGEYGMSELSSQLYEPTARHAAAGLAEPARRYVPPPWCAVQVVDPVELRPLPVGHRGLVSFFDLANVDSVAAVVTADMGRLVPEAEAGPAGCPPGWHGLPPGACGLELHGRARGAAAKGCSLAVDMLLGDADAADFAG